MFGRELLRLGLQRKIGNGASISVWSEHWLIDGIIRAPLIRNDSININLMVKDLIDVQSRTWNRQKN